MNNKILLLSASIISIFLLTGCSAKKISVKALHPAEIPVLTSKQVITVNTFDNDKVQLSSKVEAKLASIQIDNKNYFTIANRSQLDKILTEQKLQASDLTQNNNIIKIGRLVGAQAIIGGNVTSSYEDGYYIESRKKCVSRNEDGKCVKMRSFKVRCITTAANVSANLNIIDVESATTLYANTITKNYNGDSCRSAIQTGQQSIITLADAIASDFAQKLAPLYVYYSIELMEDVDSIKLNDKQEQLFENALQYIENGRITKAEILFDTLHDEVSEQSFEIAYNLGVIKQSFGKYTQAKSLYQIADEITMEPNQLIDDAILNIDVLIIQQKIAKSQLYN